MLSEDADVAKELEKAGFKKDGKKISKTEVIDGVKTTKKCESDKKCYVCTQKQGKKEKCTRVKKSNMQKFKDGLSSAYEKTKSAAKKAWAATKAAANKAVRWVKKQFSGAEQVGLATAGVIVTSALMF